MVKRAKAAPAANAEISPPARRKRQAATPPAPSAEPVAAPAPPRRQVRYSPEVVERLCLELMEGRSMRAACEPDDMPAPSTVYRWLHERDDFRDQYARAREVQAEGYVDQIIEIADDGLNDYVAREGGGYVLDKEAIARSALRIEARKWIAVKLLPKKYGDRSQVDHAHGFAAMDDAELAAQIAQELRNLGVKPPE